MIDREACTGHAAGEASNWSEAEILALTGYFEAAMPMIRIAAHLGRSKRSVAVKACRLGLTRRCRKSVQSDPATPRCTIRRCLNCEDLFYSEGKGNRICMRCKNSDDWQSGGDWSEYCP